MNEENKRPMTPDDWKALLGDQEKQHEAADILNQPMTREEEDEAYSQEMADMQAYFDQVARAEVEEREQAEEVSPPVPPEPPKPKKKDAGQRHLELQRIVREENEKQNLGMDLSAQRVEVAKRLAEEVEQGLVEDPALKDYDPGEYVLNTSPDFYDPVIEGLLNRRTINEINGDAGAGKTTLLVQMAVSLAMGRPLFNCFRVCNPGVSVFFTEDPDSVELQVAAWSLRTGVNLRDWIKVFKRPADLMEPGKLRIQKSRVLQFANGRPVNLVIFDSKMFHLAAANNNGVSMDENSNTDQQLITTAGHRFAESLNCAGIFIPHVSKGSLMSGQYDLESRGGSAAKGAVYKTFSLVREKTQTGKGLNARQKETGYTVLNVGKSRQGGLKGRFKLKGFQVPVFAKDVEEKKKSTYEKKLAPGQEVDRPDFIYIDDATKVWLFEDRVYDMDAGTDEEHFEQEEKRQAHVYTPLQEAVYSLLRAEPHGTAPYKEILHRISSTVFKADGTPYSRESVRDAIYKMAELGHLSKESNPHEARNPYYTIKDAVPPLMGSCRDNH